MITLLKPSEVYNLICASLANDFEHLCDVMYCAVGRGGAMEASSAARSAPVNRNARPAFVTDVRYSFFHHTMPPQLVRHLSDLYAFRSKVNLGFKVIRTVFVSLLGRCNASVNFDLPA